MIGVSVSLNCTIFMKGNDMSAGNNQHVGTSDEAVAANGLTGDAGIEGGAATLARAAVKASLDIGLSIVDEMATKKAAGQLANG